MLHSASRDPLFTRSVGAVGSGATPFIWTAPKWRYFLCSRRWPLIATCLRSRSSICFRVGLPGRGLPGRSDPHVATDKLRVFLLEGACPIDEFRDTDRSSFEPTLCQGSIFEPV